MVKKLGGFQFSNEVSKNTSHVVAGTPRRTLNILMGIARGCWIVCYEWVSDMGALKANREFPLNSPGAEFVPWRKASCLYHQFLILSVLFSWLLVCSG